MINFELNRLIRFALSRGLIGEEDVNFSANSLIAALGISEFKVEPVPDEELDTPDAILNCILNWAAESGLMEGTDAERDLLDTRLMGCLTPRPSEVTARFESLMLQSPEKATDYFYALGIASNYIRKLRVDRNICWRTLTEYGELDITINLSKPEKDPGDIAKARGAVPSGYPKCLLCPENEGFAGTFTHPARQNLRLIPMNLSGKRWFFQYSPYGYYNEHCIVLSEQHVPMKMSRETFENLIAFLDVLPHYFIGSNADLPIVGGSILSHEHYQGGRYCFAMEKAPVEVPYSFNGFEGVSAGRVKWPMPTLRLRSSDAAKLVDLCMKILESWRSYSDPSADILAFSGAEPHNTITPIARIRDGMYEMDLVLRNNRTSAVHPMGIFHPHDEQHHIKKENIGLIEVMGLAVLPPRLSRSLFLLEKVWNGDTNIDENPELEAHGSWYNSLKLKYPSCSGDGAAMILRREVGLVFLQVLNDAAVYKRTPEGLAAFDRFLNGL